MGNKLSPVLCDIHMHILKNISSACINYFTASDMWMLLSFLFLSVLILLAYFILSIWLTFVSKSQLKSKTMALFLFLMCWFRNIRTNFSSSLCSLRSSSLTEKGLLFLFTFFVLCTFAVINLIFPKNLIAESLLLHFGMQPFEKRQNI